MTKQSYRSGIRMLILFLSLGFTIFITSNAVASMSAFRLAGIDRYQTAVVVAKSGWTDGSDFVILATGENYTDALSAAPIAKRFNAPILLTARDSLTKDTLNQIKHWNPKKVYIVGGEAVISSMVVDSLNNEGINVERLAGVDRFETSVRIAEKLGICSEAFIVSGEEFSDGLSVAPIAAKKGIPILLVAKNDLPDSVKKYLAEQKITKTYVVGGSDIINSNVISQLPNPEIIDGNDKYDRNINIINKFSSELDFTNVYFATGQNFPDALAGSALAPQTSSPIVLLNPKPGLSTKKLIQDKSVLIKLYKILGGTAVVSTETLSSLDIYEPIAMDKILKPYNIVGGFSSDNSNPIKLVGKKYSSGYQIKCYEHGAAIYFNLEGKYHTINGVMGLDDNTSYSSPIASASVIISGDGKILGQYQLKRGDLPQDLYLDVNGVKKLSIKVDGAEAMKIDLVDVMIM